MSSDGSSFSRQGVYVGTDWVVGCYTYDDHFPVLDISAGPVSVAVSIVTQDVADGAAVNFARELVRQAQVFAAEVGRIHALHAEGNGEADDSTVA